MAALGWIRFSKRRFDVVMAWAIDRLGRSLIDLLGTIQTLEACGVDLYLDQQAIDTTTPAGRLMFQVTGAFAEFERSMIRQRVHAGLKRAVEAGKTLGRPRISAAVEKRIQTQLRDRQGHHQGCPRSWRRHRHRAAHCPGDGSPFRRRGRVRPKRRKRSACWVKVKNPNAPAVKRETAAVAFQAAFSAATVSCFRKTWFGTIWLGYRGINAARPQSLPTELNMTKSPTRESPPQANEEPPPRHRNIYDYDGEYEFPHCAALDARLCTGRRDVRHSRASHDFHQLTESNAGLHSAVTQCEPSVATAEAVGNAGLREIEPKRSSAETPVKSQWHFTLPLLSWLRTRGGDQRLAGRSNANPGLTGWA
jgi:hypothetical protein